MQATDLAEPSNLPKRILVVDDDAHIRDVLYALLTKEGYEVETADNGDKALAAIEKSSPHVLLTDVNMPGMTGIDLLERVDIKNHDYEAIVLTGLNTLEMARKAMELGAFSYMTKPFDFADLRNHVEKALEMSSLKQEKRVYVETLEKKVADRTSELESLLGIMKEKDRRLDTILNSMREGLLALDGEERIVMMNLQAQKILGLSFGKCAGEIISTSLADGDLKNRLLSLIRSGATVESDDNSIQIERKGEGVKHFLVGISDYCNESGETIGKIIALFDQTEKISAERMRSSFLSIVSHELRTPVNVLINYLSLIQSEEDRFVIDREHVEDMLATGQRLKHLVNNIIHMANLSAPYVECVFAKTDIKALVTKSTELFAAEIEGKGLRVQIKSHLEMRNPIVEPKILGIILKCLFSNAVKFSPKNSKIVISMMMEEPEPANSLRIVVEDEGEGIPDSRRAFLFQSFYQAENALTRKHGGIGTGLYLVKLALNAIGGKVEVASQPGKGTRFAIRIPVKEKGSTIQDAHRRRNG